MPDTSKEGSSGRSDSAISGSGFEWERYDGVLFDLDGVITPTATIHESAWRELFADYKYTESDYLEYIDGKPRYDGVRSFLASRGVVLPEGSQADPPGTATVCGMGNRKNELFTAMLRRDGIEPFPGSMATLELLAAGGIPAAIVSSSKNAVPVLAAAGLENRFEVVVDGLVAEADGLEGKPAPDGYLLGASRLGVAPDRTVVVEDAVAGVAAGAAGHFVVTIGVDRGAGADALLAAGATFVVGDLAELLPERADEPTD